MRDFRVVITYTEKGKDDGRGGIRKVFDTKIVCESKEMAIAIASHRLTRLASFIKDYRTTDNYMNEIVSVTAVEEKGDNHVS